MLEESEESKDMDNKYSNRSSVPTRANCLDNKKDNVQSKNYKQRNSSRQKDGGGPRQQGNANGRPGNQKYRGSDKRPRPRGYGNDSQRYQVMTDVEAEPGSVFNAGSKKQSLNHLLNFSYNTERENYSTQSYNRGYGRRGYGRGGKHRGGSYVTYNKERYLQANCQFVVNDHGDYTNHSGDPDLLVNWDNLEQIRISDHEVPSCPICLYPPVAAKITRCGHCYCWTCILHYLSLSEKSWKKCPICYEAIHAKHLKSVKALATPTYKVGEEITLKLMKKERGSTYVMPVGEWTQRSGQPYNIEDKASLSFSKLLTASVDQIMAIIEEEKQALLQQLKEEGKGTLEGSYVEHALKLLDARIEELQKTTAIKEEATKLNEAALSRYSSSSEEDNKSPPPTPKETAKLQDIKEYKDAFDDEEAETPDNPTTPDNAPEPDAGALSSSPTEGELVAPPSVEAEEHDPNTVVISTAEGSVVVDVDEAVEGLDVGKSTSSEANQVFYFYQAADGQNIYLHAINAKCLVKEYGGLEYCPETIRARIVELETISMTEEFRNRLRYLNHLPLACEFQVAELAIKAPVLSKDTIKCFADEIERRKRLRQRKQRDEKRRTKRIQDKEREEFRNTYRNIDMTIIPSAMHSNPDPAPVTTIVPSAMHQSASASILVPQQRRESECSSTPSSTPIGSPPDSSASLSTMAEDDDGGQTSMSFAQMLRAGKTKQQTPVFRPSKSDTSLSARAKGSDESDNEDRVPVPVFGASFGDAIQQALEKKTEGNGEGPQQGGKKKKKVKKLLFTTTMPRSK